MLKEIDEDKNGGVSEKEFKKHFLATLYRKKLEITKAPSLPPEAEDDLTFEYDKEKGVIYRKTKNNPGEKAQKPGLPKTPER